MTAAVCAPQAATRLHSPVEFRFVHCGAAGADVSQLVLDATFYLGTAMASMAGTITAGSCEMDLFGCTIVGTLTAIGGGTIRDIILGRTVYWLTDTSHLTIALAVSVGIFLTSPPARCASLHTSPCLSRSPSSSPGPPSSRSGCETRTWPSCGATRSACGTCVRRRRLVVKAKYSRLVVRHGLLVHRRNATSIASRLVRDRHIAVVACGEA